MAHDNLPYAAARRLVEYFSLPSRAPIVNQENYPTLDNRTLNNVDRRQPMRADPRTSNYNEATKMTYNDDRQSHQRRGSENVPRDRPPDAWAPGIHEQGSLTRETKERVQQLLDFLAAAPDVGGLMRRIWEAVDLHMITQQNNEHRNEKLRDESQLERHKEIRGS